MLTLDIATEIETKAGMRLGAEPRIYSTDEETSRANLIAEGTDGNLYLVPAEAGGWLQRAAYKGCSKDLAPLSSEKAQTLMWFVYGEYRNGNDRWELSRTNES